MDRAAIIERVAAERWDKIANEANEQMGCKVIQTWSDLSANEKSWKAGHIEHILTAFGAWELLEAANAILRKAEGMNPYDSVDKMSIELSGLTTTLAKVTGVTP